MDSSGVICVKSGSDKRRVTALEEMQRMFQNAQLVHGDDIPIAGTSIADIDLEYFRRFLRDRLKSRVGGTEPLAEPDTFEYARRERRYVDSKRCSAFRERT